MRIDSHTGYSSRYTLDHLGSILSRNRFDGAVLVAPWVELPSHIVGIVVPADLRDPRLGDRLDLWQTNPKFLGVRAGGGELAPDGLRELARRGLPLDLDIAPGDLAQVPRIAELAPALRVVIDHLARPRFGSPMSDEWARGLEDAARLPQVMCKASSLLTGCAEGAWQAADFRPFLQHALTVFGPARLMFGSDWPASLPAAGWKENLAAFTQSIGALPVEVREELLGGAARSFYGIL